MLLLRDKAHQSKSFLTIKRDAAAIKRNPAAIKRDPAAIKQDPVSVELEVLGEFRSWGEAIVDLGDGCIKGFECISRGRSDGV